MSAAVSSCRLPARAWWRLIVLASALAALPVHAGVTPKTLLIYYSYPSSINGTFGVPGAAAVLGHYDYVVLGDLLEKTSHPDHANTVEIIAHPAMSATTVFGYINLAVSVENLSLAEIQTRVDEWRATGAQGIFFDLFGYDYGTSRTRQNAAVDYAHGRGMPVVANAWVPADAFGADVNAYNPSATLTSLNASDFYLAESYQIMLDQFVAEPQWRTKTDALAAFQGAIGFKVLSVTTSDVGGSYDQDKFFYTWYSALLDGHEATGWGEYLYSALSASAPFQARPAVDAGVAFTGGVVRASPVFTRTTGAGTVFVNTSTHAAGFTPVLASALVPGGGGHSECKHEWYTQPLPPLGANGLPRTALTCTDDDPACDFGLPGDNACTFHVALCFNVAESRFSCAPSDVQTVLIRSPGISQDQVTDVTNRDALEAALDVLGAHTVGTCTNSGPHHGASCQSSSTCDSTAGDASGRCKRTAALTPALTAVTQCTPFVSIKVPLRSRTTGFARATKTLRITAAPANDRSDTDDLRLTCAPHG